MPFSKSDGYAYDDEVLVVARVVSADLGIVSIENDPHGADLGWLVGEHEPYDDGFAVLLRGFLSVFTDLDF